MLTIAEDLLVASTKKRLLFGNVAFYEIPENERSPEMPQRLRAGLTPDLEAKLAEKAKGGAKLIPMKRNQ